MTAATTAALPVRASVDHDAALHWGHCAIEGALLGTFMVSACAFTVLLEHPAIGGPALITAGLARRAIIGVGMALTAVGLIYSPWGRRSGAHMNPAVTLSFLRLGMISPADAARYVIAQFLGGLAGVALCAAVGRRWLADPAVSYAATIPGTQGVIAAWVGEFGIAFLLMTTVLALNRHANFKAFTGYCAAGLVAIYVTFEAPLSGMSLNPARTFASAVWAGIWRGWWVYFTAPVLGMLVAVELQLRINSHPQWLCARLHHCPKVCGVFRCNCGRSSGIDGASNQADPTRRTPQCLPTPTTT
jgi:aquaporin Z